ncbi:MAG TPA: glycosyltransferase family 2 protein [Thermoanaerobaculia bacterium]|nr:glycosyltransferase family 2 protein [Thermoanaerobaculia bacterium]
MNTNLLSVIFPLYNEEGNLQILVEELRSVLRGAGLEFEIIAVDDGSTDGSAAELRRVAAAYPELRVVTLHEKSGQTAAIHAGLLASSGDLVALLDADLQNDPADIPRLLEHLVETDSGMVAGVRVNRQDAFSKRLQSKIGNTVRNWITGDRITDTGCSLKVARRECLERIRWSNGMHRFLPTLIRIEGYEVVEMAVNHRPRRYGRSKYGAWNRAFRGLMDCFAVRRISRSGRQKPLG